jgi:hypothetical protein
MAAKVNSKKYEERISLTSNGGKAGGMGHRRAQTLKYKGGLIMGDQANKDIKNSILDCDTANWAFAQGSSCTFGAFL